MTGKKRVVVIMGGISSEREVSLVSGAAITKALRESGFD
ncbi:MAG: D-alanine--D-alanine ligase, partial [Alphaproteobacteria bacterium]|nr:D-alanine--D-alanine ligase [Alphaproteobacteria bacterium]